MGKTPNEKISRVRDVSKKTARIRNEAKKIMRDFEANPSPTDQEGLRYRIAQYRMEEVRNIRGSILWLLDVEIQRDNDQFEEILKESNRRSDELIADPDSAGLHTSYINDPYWIKMDKRGGSKPR